MNRFGPSRGELKFRLIASLAGLAFLIGGFARTGIFGIASLEIVIIGGAFFGGSALWSAWQLWKDPQE